MTPATPGPGGRGQPCATSTTTSWSSCGPGWTDDAVLVAPESTEAYRFDMAKFCPAGRPGVVVRPRTTAQVQHVMRVASRARRRRRAAGRPVRAVRRCQRRRGRHRALAGPDGPRPRDRRGRAARGRAARRRQRGAVPGGAGARAVLPAGPVELGLVDDRRQRRDQRRRAVLREVRRHRRLRARAGGGARRRHRGAHRAAHRQGRRRLRPHPAAGRAPRARWASSPRSPWRCAHAPEPALTLAAVFDSPTSALDAVARIMASGDRAVAAGVPRRRRRWRRSEPTATWACPSTRQALLLAQSDRGVRGPPRTSRAMAEICRELGALDVAEATDAEESAMLLEARRLVGPAMDAARRHARRRRGGARASGWPTCSSASRPSPRSTTSSSPAPGTPATATCTRP